MSYGRIQIKRIRSKIIIFRLMIILQVALAGDSKPMDSWKSTLGLELVVGVTFIVLKDTLSDITVSYGRLRIKRIKVKL